MGGAVLEACAPSRALYFHTVKRALRIAFVSALIIVAFGPAADAAGVLTISEISAPNLIGDSNVSSQAGAGPDMFFVGARACNAGTTALEDVYVYFGDGTTPGIFPPTVIAPGTRDYEGTFALESLDPTFADARRFLGSLAADQCITVYWPVRYQVVDDNNNATWGASNTTEDDLAYQLHVWGDAYDPATTAPVQASEIRTVTVRNEITAAANKLSPTGNPAGYQVVSPSGVLGVGNLVSVSYFNATFGQVGQGFDLVDPPGSDYDAYIQPTGESALFDPTQFRLVGVEGVLRGGQCGGGRADPEITFVDQWYFTDLDDYGNCAWDADYTYTFLVMSPSGSSVLAAYQEVASGSDNEKYNNDYCGDDRGGNCITLTSGAGGNPQITASVDPLCAETGDSATFKTDYAETTGQAAGYPQSGSPVVFENPIPAGFAYTAGSAACSVSCTIYFSTDGGASYGSTEPATAASVSNLRFSLNDPIPANGTGDVSYAATVITSIPAIVTSTTSVRLGLGPVFDTTSVDLEISNACVECTVDADCDDTFYCNGAEQCVAGQCVAASPVNCDDGVDCTVDSCNEATDSCDNTPNNALCDDGAYCNGVEVCNAVSDCVAGTPVDCSDGVGCTDDTCNEATDSCVNTPNNANCDDSAYCNGVETCDATLDCQAGTPVVCDDGVDCTGDTCNEGTDSCDSAPNNANCDDGAYCNGVETCDATLGCQAGAGVDCADGVDCTVDSCNEGTDSCDNTPNNALCDDGVYCNGVEVCNAVSDCVAGTPVDCSDGVSCTDDTCNEATDSCVSTPNNANCDDSAFCNGVETCDATLDCQAGTPVVCDDGVDCTDDTCNEGTDSCDSAPNNANCDDGAYCNGVETCDAALGCQAGAGVDCADGVGCTVDSCNEATDSCDNTPNNASCDDGSYCNGVEVCNAISDCVAGTPVDCSDGVGCTDDTCNEATDSCVNSPDNSVCDNGLYCDGSETCDGAAGCQGGAPVDCSDSVDCTADACNDTTDSCDNTPNNGLCGDGEECTDDVCNAVTGCQYTNNSAPCDDGDACTLGDICSGGTCTPGTTPVNCDDNDVCTTDTCDGAGGCLNTPGAQNCDDANECTDDTCDAVAGCQYVNNTDPCDDGDNCTTLDACLAGSCTSVPVDCSALDDFCSVGTCNPATGGCLKETLDPEVVCSDSNDCTLDICDPVAGCSHQEACATATDIAVSCYDGVDPVRANQAYAYYAEVVNNGPEPAAEVSADIYPDPTLEILKIPSECTQAPAGQGTVITCDAGILAVGEVRLFEIRVKPTPSTPTDGSGTFGSCDERGDVCIDCVSSTISTDIDPTNDESREPSDVQSITEVEDPGCGNGVVDAGEECDPGSVNEICSNGFDDDDDGHVDWADPDCVCPSVYCSSKCRLVESPQRIYKDPQRLKFRDEPRSDTYMMHFSILTSDALDPSVGVSVQVSDTLGPVVTLALGDSEMSPSAHGGWRLEGVKSANGEARFRVTKPRMIGAQYRYGVYARNRGRYRLPVSNNLETVLTVGEQSFRIYESWTPKFRPNRRSMKSLFLLDKDIENSDPCEAAPGATP